MALTVGTDTYISLADAEVYIADFGPDGAEVDEASLRKATLAIDRLYGGRFAGERTSDTQALQFPRDGSEDIPLAVQHATVELAVMIFTGTDPYVQPDPVLTEESIEIDVIKQSRKFAGSGYSANLLHKINVILGSLLYSRSALGSMEVIRG